MAGKGRGLGLNRREVALGLAIVPLASCASEVPTDDSLTKSTDSRVAPDDPKKLVELIKLDPTIKLDIRYATVNNITGRALYDMARAFLASAPAQALVRANQAARTEGYGLTIFDAYRPWRVTKQLWDATPAGSKKNYVANPKRGSKHNRGCAVDLSLHDLKSGMLVEMPSEYDEFSGRAHRDYMDASPAAMANRARLQRYMEAEDFAGISNEWWHFDFLGWEEYPVMDTPFNEIA